MTETELQIFAANYTASDFDRIKFDWNGEHADKLLDTNYDFRMRLCEYLVGHLESVDLQLIRDLYIELSKWSKEAWCVYDKYHLLAHELLTRGGTTFIMDYLDGSTQCFDTVLASARLTLTVNQKQKILAFLTSRLKTETEDRRIHLLQVLKYRFE